MHTTKGTTTYGHRLLIGVYIATLLMTMVSAQEETPKMKCFQCSSKDSQECLDYSKLQTKECDEATKCFTKNDNGVITRGCFTSNVECSGDNCKLCDANADTACNNHNICKKCTGDDVACSQTDASADKYNDICATSATECFVNVKDKKVERRCASDSDSCDASSSTCRKTSGAISNTGIFPSSRIHCYQCSESGCSDITTSNVKSQPCQNYDVDDQCYMLAESDTKIERGCKSDSGSKCSGSTEDSKDCYSCKTDNCNNSTYKKNQKLKCIQCEGSDCFKEQQASEAKDCKEEILYNAEESCITMLTNSGIYRGCLHDNAEYAEECGKENSSCKKCNTTDGCNKEAEENSFTCIVCRSDEKKECWNDADTLTGQTCRTGSSSPEEGCFHGIWNGVAIRGCMIDADEKVKATCLDDNNHQCRACNTKDCNKEKSSSGQSISIFTGLIIMMISAIWYLN
uniref:DUF753 domain-containing protein n=1 Tax=Haematobia irritans TaxID=7368 RepID=A0A1L8EIA9_HAEIR